jgi:hypothetical protein
MLRLVEHPTDTAAITHADNTVHASEGSSPGLRREISTSASSPLPTPTDKPQRFNRLAVDLSGDIHITELSFNLESIRASSRVLILTAGQGRPLLLRRARGGLSGFLFATSINVHELPVEVVPQRVLDKTRYVSKVVDGEVFKRGSEGINGLCEVLRSGWFFGEAIA